MRMAGPQDRATAAHGRGASHAVATWPAGLISNLSSEGAHKALLLPAATVEPLSFMLDANASVMVRRSDRRSEA